MSRTRQRYVLVCEHRSSWVDRPADLAKLRLVRKLACGCAGLVHLEVQLSAEPGKPWVRDLEFDVYVAERYLREHVHLCRVGCKPVKDSDVADQYEIRCARGKRLIEHANERHAIATPSRSGDDGGDRQLPLLGGVELVLGGRERIAKEDEAMLLEIQAMDDEPPQPPSDRLVVADAIDAAHPHRSVLAEALVQVRAAGPSGMVVPFDPIDMTAGPK